jgi:hypothetical protein
MKMQNIQKLVSSFGLVSVFAAALLLAGCGGGDSGSSNTPSNNDNNNNNQGGPAPAGIGGKTFNGRIGGTTTTWQIVFTGGDTSGTYSYGENGHHLENGNYTYSKTGANTGVITLTDGSTIQLTYSAHNAGNYLIPKSSETGTFTSN